MGMRRKAREYVLQALYLSDLSPLEPEKIIKNVTDPHKTEKDMMEFATRLFEVTLKNKTLIDEKIVSVAKNWEINRMAVLDRNILRMGIAEIIFELDTPLSVVINEAVELAKSFSTDDSGKFVNGILDKLKQERPSS